MRKCHFFFSSSEFFSPWLFLLSLHLLFSVIFVCAEVFFSVASIYSIISVMMGKNCWENTVSSQQQTEKVNKNCFTFFVPSKTCILPVMRRVSLNEKSEKNEIKKRHGMRQSARWICVTLSASFNPKKRKKNEPMLLFTLVTLKNSSISLMSFVSHLIVFFFLPFYADNVTSDSNKKAEK